MAKTEDIEAKLAAYVDGDLDEAGRAEIEKHLANNTQHRRLIRELMQHRDLLKNLPREMAPAEVCESINAQLERAVLLGDVDGDGEVSSMRIGSWHQFRAIAAILVVTACLAAVIAMLLPRPGSKPGEIADVRALPAPTARSADIAAPESPPPALGGGRPADVVVSQPEASLKSSEPLTVAAAPRDEAAPATTAPALAEGTTTEQQRRATLALNDPLVRGGFGSNRMDPGAQNPANSTVVNSALPGEQLFSPMVNRVDLDAAARAAEPLVVLVPSDNPSYTNQQVTEYLSRNNIVWEAQPEPMPQALDIPRSQVAYGARVSEQQYQVKVGDGASSGFGGGGRGGRGGAGLDLNQGAQVSQGQVSQQQMSQAPAEMQAVPSPNLSPENRQQAAAGPGDPQFRVFDPAENSRQIMIGGDGANALQAQQPTPSQEQRIVAKRLNGQQLAELRVTLSRLKDQATEQHPLSIANATPVAGINGDNVIDRQGQGAGASNLIAAPSTLPTLPEVLHNNSNQELDRAAANRSRTQAAPTTVPSELLTLVFPRFYEVQRPIGTGADAFRSALRFELTNAAEHKSADNAAIFGANDAAAQNANDAELHDVVIVVQPQPATQPATMPSEVPANQ